MCGQRETFISTKNDAVALHAPCVHLNLIVFNWNCAFDAFNEWIFVSHALSSKLDSGISSLCGKYANDI